MGISQELTRAIEKKQILERRQEELQNQILALDKRIDELRVSWVDQLKRSAH
ncbi:MAG TPA: hypothetical protein VFK37_03855 [Bacillales bacterium]|nr:hypothetical protein [Bacillales bacterium]